VNEQKAKEEILTELINSYVDHVEHAKKYSRMAQVMTIVYLIALVITLYGAFTRHC